MKTRAWDGERFRDDYVIASDGTLWAIPEGCNVGWSRYSQMNIGDKLDWKLSRFYENHMNPENEIWEHDIVSCNVLGSGIHRGTVVYIDGCFDVLFPYPIMFLDGIVRDRYYVKCFTVNHAIKVIGNVFQNPELLEVK